MASQHFRQMVRCSLHAGLLGALLLSGCAGGSGGKSPSGESAAQPRWSTKNDAALAARSDRTRLATGEALPLRDHSPEDLAGWKAEALSVLSQAASSTNPLLRANAIQALHGAPEHLEPAVRQGLGDENRGVRFVAAMTVGQMQMTGMAALLEPLLHDESASVQAAAMYGLKRCGRSVDLTPLAGMLMSDDAETRGNAAMVLGEIGEPTAIRLLRHSVGRNLNGVDPSRRRVVELQLAEAMVKLGDRQMLEGIHAALFAPPEQGELTALACQICGELRDASALGNLLDLATRQGQRRQSAEVRMAATAAIARIEPIRAPLSVPAEYVASTHFHLRTQAAHTIGQLAAAGADPDACVTYLSRLMKDVNSLVQVTAAGGMLRVPERPAVAAR